MFPKDFMDVWFARLVISLTIAEDAYIVVDDTRRILMISPRTEDLLNIPAQRIVERPVEYVLPHLSDADLAGLEHPLKPTAVDSQLFRARIVTVARCADGVLVPVEAIASPAELEEGHVSVIRLQDISSRVELQRQLHLHSDVAAVLAASYRPADALHRVLEVIGEFLDADDGALWVLDSTPGLLRRTQVWHRPSSPVSIFTAPHLTLTVRLGEGPVGQALAGNTVQWVTHEESHITLDGTSDAAKRRMGTVVAVPMRCDDAIPAVMEFLYIDEHGEEQDWMQLLQTLGSQIANYIRRKHVNDEG